MTNAVLPALRASKAAAIVNISSTAATTPFPFDVHYGAAKAALDYYSRTLAVERLRVEAARVRLQEGAEPIEVIAQALGFTDPERMRRAFVKLFGMSPQAVRRLDRSHEHKTEASSQRED